MSAQHTPGPLEVRLEGTCSSAWAVIVQRCIDPATNEVWFRELGQTETTHVERTKANGQPIKGVPGDISEKPERFEPTDDSAELIANAHLWAAAPEQNAALIGLLELVELLAANCADRVDVTNDPRIPAAHAAIAKATSQQGGAT
jgi:hypothetical protein